jgi:pyruvate,water dikinase
MDAGGILSHGAIVAREFGVPAVVGAMTAVIRIPEGATVTVDGSNGVVVVELDV